MNLSYVRQQVIIATADLSGATKGQLTAWVENAQFDTGRFKRKKNRVYDKESRRWIVFDNPPIPGKQSLAKGSSIALVQPVEFATASWRRALLALDEHQKSWLLWSYGENIRWEHQGVIVKWGWEEFKQQISGKRLAGKTVERLRQLIWLAAQDVKAELAGKNVYEHKQLAELAGVNKSTWSANYMPHWIMMRSAFRRLDSQALIAITRSRSQQKAANYEQVIAKPN